jgi:hypothetical protein
MVFRTYIWAWRMQPEEADKLCRIQMYHALRDPEDNAETIRLLEEDPYCQLVFATVAFANGLNVRSFIVSPTIEPNRLRLRFKSMWDWQAKCNAPSGMAKYPLA